VTRRIIAIAVLVLLLAAVGWQWHADNAEAQEHTLTSVDPDAATHMAVALKGLPDQRFERRNGRWVNLDATATDEGRAEELVSLAATPVADWKPAGDFDPVKIGLAPPIAVLTIDGTRIEFGEMTALGKQRYARVGKRIAFVPAQALPRAPRTQALPTTLKPVP
jgi:hypothetical protein